MEQLNNGRTTEMLRNFPEQLQTTAFETSGMRTEKYK